MLKLDHTSTAPGINITETVEAGHRLRLFYLPRLRHIEVWYREGGVEWDPVPTVVPIEQVEWWSPLEWRPMPE